MTRQFALGTIALAAITGTSMAALVQTGVDVTPTGAEGSGITYFGAGTGFGGTVGNGSITLDSDATNLYINFTMGGGIDNIIAIWFDTRAGGFTDATMEDQNDGSRRALTQLANATDDAFDANFLPDFGITMGNFGNVQFELNGDATIPFINFEGDTSTGTRGYTIPLASIGVLPGGTIDFMVGYISDSGYMSNESIPAYEPLQTNGNPGFGDGQFGGTVGSPGIGNYNRFVTVPTPGATALLGLAGVAAIRRRRA